MIIEKDELTVTIPKSDFEKLKNFVKTVSDKNFEFYQMVLANQELAERVGGTNRELMERIEEMSLRITELERIRLRYEGAIADTRRAVSKLKNDYELVPKKY